MRWLLVVGVFLAGLAFAQGYAPSQYLSPGEIVSQVQDAGTLGDARKDFHANTFVASAIAPDGGAGVYGYVCEQESCTWKVCASSQCEITGSNNELTLTTGLVNLPTTKVALLSAKTNSNLTLNADTGYWISFVPTTSTAGCAAGTAGGFRYRSDRGKHVACNGSSIVPYLQEGGPWDAEVDFAAFASNSCQTITYAASGAVFNERVSCGGCGSVFNGDPNLGCSCGISATDTAAVRLCCESPPCADLAPFTFSIAATR